MRDAATAPKTIVAAINIQANTGFSMQASVSFMAMARVRPVRVVSCWLLVVGQAA
jgi:hypothetical protein